MAIPIYDSESRNRINAGIIWTEAQRGLVHGEPTPEHPNQQLAPPIRGYLMQNVYGNGSGAMQLAYRSESPYASSLSIVGRNYVESSQFKLKLSGVPVSGTTPVLTELFITQPINVDSTADDLKTKLLLAAGTASLPVRRTDISVSLGNPMSSTEFVLPLDPNSTPEIVLSDTEDPKAYVGVWLIDFAGALTQQYSSLKIDVVQDTTAFMRGLSAIVSKQIVDLPGETIQIVFDVMNRPIDYPWVAGSLCGAISYRDLGYGIMWSDFRNQEVNIPLSDG